MDETGAHPPGSSAVWTGTGLYAYATTDRCSSEWSSTNNNGTVGNLDAMNGGWTDSGPAACNRTDVHLYCFEQ